MLCLEDSVVVNNTVQMVKMSQDNYNDHRFQIFVFKCHSLNVILQTITFTRVVFIGAVLLTMKKRTITVTRLFQPDTSNFQEK